MADTYLPKYFFLGNVVTYDEVKQALESKGFEASEDRCELEDEFNKEIKHVRVCYKGNDEYTVTKA